MRYSFDPAKDAANLLKHGISLTEGDGVLCDPLGLTIEDSCSEGERRWVSIGMNPFVEPRVVVWSQHLAMVRIISVRKPAPKERRAYEKGI
jgi:uncharacterized DUF497 family protein